MLTNQRLTSELKKRQVFLDQGKARPYHLNQHALQRPAHSAKVGFKFEFSRPKLRNFLLRNGRYSDKHRAEVWAFFLGIPLVGPEYLAQLTALEQHEAVKWVGEEFPIRDPELLKAMMGVASLLAHACPLFAQAKTLPGFIFPFVKLFGQERELCFQVVVKVTATICQHFFMHFPNPAVQLSQAVEEILAFEDQPLHQYFTSLDNHITDFVWPLLEHLFSQQLKREDWLTLWDFLVSYEDQPQMLVYFVVAFSKHYREEIMGCSGEKALKAEARKERYPDMGKLLHAVRMMSGKNLILKTGLTYQKAKVVNSKGRINPDFVDYPHEAVKECRNNRMVEEIELDRLRNRVDQVAQIHSYANKVMADDTRQLQLMKKLNSWEEQQGSRALARRVELNIPERTSHISDMILAIQQSIKKHKEIKKSLGSQPSMVTMVMKNQDLEQLAKVEELENKMVGILTRYQDVVKSTKVMERLGQSVPLTGTIQTAGPLEGHLRADLIEMQSNLRKLQEKNLLKKYQKLAITK